VISVIPNEPIRYLPERTRSRRPCNHVRQDRQVIAAIQPWLREERRVSRWRDSNRVWKPAARWVTKVVEFDIGLNDEEGRTTAIRAELDRYRRTRPRRISRDGSSPIRPNFRESGIPLKGACTRSGVDESVFLNAPARSLWLTCHFDQLEVGERA
jgi:hypothetical protein